MFGGRSSPQVKAGSIDPALGHAGGVVAAVEREVLVAVADAVAEVRVAPAQRADDILGVGIEQQLVRVEAVAVPGRRGRARGSRRAGRAAPRADSSARPGRSARAARCAATSLAPGGDRTGRARPCGVLGKHGEVHAFAIPGRPARGRCAGPDGVDDWFMIGPQYTQSVVAETRLARSCSVARR